MAKKNTGKKKQYTKKGAHIVEAGKATRFVSGDPRQNKNGRPKVLPRMKALMEAMLGGTEDEDITETPIAEVVKLLLKEMKNQKLGAQRVAAGKELLERAFGRVRTAEEVEGVEGAPEKITGFNIKRK